MPTTLAPDPSPRPAADGAPGHDDAGAWMHEALLCVVTPMALAGLLVGTVLCFTNMYFGLQTGWVTMGSIQCALLGKYMTPPWDAARLS